ncbi:hypothetical protein HYPSUDRAFT_105751, partial [Hypholoma sublateritium FD-334 SS-4]
SLRDHLLAALAGHPGTRTHHVHALVSTPRRTAEPFPFATPRAPRVWVQDILVLLAEEGVGDGEEKEEGGRVLTTAVSAALFLVPATASGILYISKVDTTGQARAPSPAAALVRALVGYFAHPATRPAPARGVVRHLWVHVFARAQAQYLFSGSADVAGKRPLGDVQLCAWWRRLLGRVAEGVGGAARVRMSYVLPGLSAAEAAHALGGGAAAGWAYGHPYRVEGGVPLPCPAPPAEEAGTKRKAGAGLNLGCVIPSFDDDPKARFMDEIAYTELRSPRPKRARREGDERRAALGELGAVSADEFWERMSFRQECVAGAVTGFFTLVVSGGGPAGDAAVPEAAPGQVGGQVAKRLLTMLLEGVEFSSRARAVRATATVDGAVAGLCDGSA